MRNFKRGSPECSGNDPGREAAVHHEVDTGCEDATVFGVGKSAFGMKDDFLLFDLEVTRCGSIFDAPGFDARAIIEEILACALGGGYEGSEAKETDSKVWHGAIGDSVSNDTWNEGRCMGELTFRFPVSAQRPFSLTSFGGCGEGTPRTRLSFSGRRRSSIPSQAGTTCAMPESARFVFRVGRF